MPDSTKVSAGVQQLIDRLRSEGVTAGEKEAKDIIAKAKQEAAKIVAAAKDEAEGYRQQSRADIEREKASARAALEMAVRDTIIEMRAGVASRFRAQVERLVTAELRDKEFLRRLILAIAARSVPDGSEPKAIEVLIADSLFAEGHADHERFGKEIDSMVMGITAEMLREGIEIKPAGDEKAGIRARLVGEQVEIDLTDEALSQALLRHMLPRFRYIVQGVEGQE